MLKTTLKNNNNNNNKKWTDRTLGQMVKAKLYRQNHTQKHTHTHSQKEKKGKKIYISFLPKSTFSVGDDSLSIRYSRDAEYIKLIVEI